MPVSSNRKLEFPRMETGAETSKRDLFMTANYCQESDAVTWKRQAARNSDMPMFQNWVIKKTIHPSAHKTWNTKKSWWISQPKDAISKDLSLDSSIDFNNSEPLPLRPLTPMMRVGILSTNDMVEVGACHQVIAGRFTMAPMTSKGWTVSKPLYHRICLKHPLRTYLNV